MILTISVMVIQDTVAAMRNLYLAARQPLSLNLNKAEVVINKHGTPITLTAGELEWIWNMYSNSEARHAR